VAKNGKVMVSVLNGPHREELYTAVRGRGAFLNGERIYIGTEERLQDAVVGMESPAGQES
jgi:myo-inositol-1(or 4)-monophosphatase